MSSSSSQPLAARDCGLELGDWLLEEYQPLSVSMADSNESEDYGEFDEDDFDDEFDDDFEEELEDEYEEIQDDLLDETEGEFDDDFDDFDDEAPGGAPSNGKGDESVDK